MTTYATHYPAAVDDSHEHFAQPSRQARGQTIADRCTERLSLIQSELQNIIDAIAHDGHPVNMRSLAKLEAAQRIIDPTSQQDAIEFRAVECTIDVVG